MEQTQQQQDTTPKDSWSPNDTRSPFYIWHLLTDEEWCVISQDYPYSVRVLVQLHDETRWSEHARTQTEEQASALMHGLARLHKSKDWWVGWVVMESACQGHEVREKPVLWYPTKEHILEQLRQAGLLKSNIQRRSRP